MIPIRCHIMTLKRDSATLVLLLSDIYSQKAKISMMSEQYFKVFLWIYDYPGNVRSSLTAKEELAGSYTLSSQEKNTVWMSHTTHMLVCHCLYILKKSLMTKCFGEKINFSSKSNCFRENHSSKFFFWPDLKPRV